MSLQELILGFHIGAGFTALVLGPVAMRAAKRRGLHTRVGEAYHWVVLLTCGLAAVLAFLDWERIWWFLPVAVGSYAFAAVGYVSAKTRWKRWLIWHVSGQGGSYIAMTTAILIVNWKSLFGVSGVESPLAWILPTLIGSPWIAWVNIRIRRQERIRRAGSMATASRPE